MSLLITKMFFFRRIPVTKKGWVSLYHREDFSGSKIVLARERERERHCKKSHAHCRGKVIIPPPDEKKRNIEREKGKLWQRRVAERRAVKKNKEEKDLKGSDFCFGCITVQY